MPITFLDEVWRFDATTLIVDDPVKRVDDKPVALGGEAPVPFLDHELVELAARRPPELKLREGGEFPLWAISRGMVPDPVIDRPKGLLPGACPVPARLRRQADGQPRGALHAQSGHQAMAPGAFGIVASVAREQRTEQGRRSEHLTTNPMAPTPLRERPRTDWQRLLLMSALWPVLWLQAVHVRRVTPRMPEPPGCRTGITGHGPPVRLLVAGDSGAAAVGAPTQDQGLCGQLVRCLSQHHTVHWCILAANGLNSPG